jgi:AcrR family transcriptional regulator
MTVPSSRVQRPTGREEVRAAVLEAAARRFAAEGPDASLRAIAEDAGVNLGLIHRHVGNKDELLRAVLEHEIAGGVHTVERAADAAEALREIFELATSDGRYIRIIAWLLLQEQAAPRHQDRYPTMQVLRAMVRARAHERDRADGEHGRDDTEADARLMIAMAAVYGWTVFGPQLRAAFDYEDAPPHVRARLDRALADVVARIV